MYKYQLTAASILLVIILQIFTGCASLEPFQASKATLGPRTGMDAELDSLPAPKEPVIAAVYSFRDQTGQYKLTSGGTSFSTAVTQGATSILIKALEDSKWFIPIEREGLSDLLNERKIIRSSRENYLGADGKKLPELPPLLYAGIILEGGIISYDTNVLTGGEGVSYFGISTSGQYHQDRVTVYLRATSTQNGRVLETVYASKTVLSQEVDAGIYRFVSLNNLLQAEVGFTYNEPVDIAVTEAIQKAVQGMVIQGVKDGLWQLKDPADTASTAFTSYVKEDKEDKNYDFLGRPITDLGGHFGIGLNLGGEMYQGDYPNTEMNTAAGLKLRYEASRDFYLELTLGRSTLSAQNSFRTNFDFLNIRGAYYFLSGFDVSPYFVLGGGLVVREKDSKSAAYPVALDYSNFGNVVWGGGIEYRVNKTIGISLELDNHYILSDNFDGMVNGKYYDYFWNGNLGINIYFGK